VTIKERLLILVLILPGCGTTPSRITPGSATPLLIESKIQTKDLKKKDTHTANVEIILLTNQAIRMEVTALFGYGIASVVMTPQKIQYALHTSKSYVQGPFSAKTLYPVFNQNIDPRLLWKIIHGQNPESADLKCSKDSAARPLHCVSTMGAFVNFSYDEENKKRIEIKNPQFEMTWVFKSQAVMDVVQNETFVLKKPDNYKEIILK
jgi:hypothetical protein